MKPPAGAGARPPAGARRLAIEAVAAVDAGARANVVVPALLARSDLAARDRAFVTELVYGTVRMRRACDWLVDRFARGRLDREVRAALRVGAYQIAFLGTPRHAAVSATVSAVDGPGRRVVNAVLRRVADLVDAGGALWPDRATQLSYPDWIIEVLVEDLGPADAWAAMAEMNRAATATTRPDGYVQDRASQMAAAHVEARRGERILDLCAAPGGKATALAGGGAFVVAADVDRARAAMVAANAGRLGCAGISVVVADGRQSPLAASTFDRVLVDAPCSGLGVLRRRPDARWRGRREDLGRLAGLQRQLVRSAIGLARPGGVVVYSVCTMTRAETAAIDSWLAKAHPDLEALPPPPAPWRPAGRGALLLPQDAGTDGMFLLALRSRP
ncbi:MAG: transcription antitermination factor NusB [Acidimicrobiales bacterium]